MRHRNRSADWSTAASISGECLHFLSWQEQCGSCESEALLNPATFNPTGGGEPERIERAYCTWPLFAVLGVDMQLGRGFVESEDQPGANTFVVVSDTLWRRRFGADASAIGKPVQIDGEPHTVLRVLRPDFRLPSGTRLGPLNQVPLRAEIFKPMGFNWAKLWRLTAEETSERYECTDDTSVTVLDREVPFARIGRIWPYVGDVHHPVIVYDYTPTRARGGPVKFLEGYKGCLQADVYSVYDAFFKPQRGTTEVGAGCTLEATCTRRWNPTGHTWDQPCT